jgi:hypothetical protein
MYGQHALTIHRAAPKPPPTRTTRHALGQRSDSDVPEPTPGQRVVPTRAAAGSTRLVHAVVAAWSITPPAVEDAAAAVVGLVVGVVVLAHRTDET